MNAWPVWLCRLRNVTDLLMVDIWGCLRDPVKGGKYRRKIVIFNNHNNWHLNIGILSRLFLLLCRLKMYELMLYRLPLIMVIATAGRNTTEAYWCLHFLCCIAALRLQISQVVTVFWLILTCICWHILLNCLKSAKVNSNKTSKWQNRNRHIWNMIIIDSKRVVFNIIIVIWLVKTLLDKEGRKHHVLAKTRKSHAF